MVAYLDKEAVLKAFKEEPLEFYNRFLHGEFDATPNGSTLVSSCLADKDSEIARLNYLIAGYHEAIAALRQSKDKEIAALIVQVHALEKFNAWLKFRVRRQDQEIKDLGEALRKAEKAVKCDGCHPKPCSGCRWENERCKYRPYAKGDHSCRYFEEPPKDEPELVICGEHKTCSNFECIHKTPHQFSRDLGCDNDNCGSGCIPYKKEEPTVPQEPDRPCQACIEGNAPHCSKPFPDCPYYGDPEPVPKDGAALEKDIGDLTLRMDLVDSRQAHDFRMITHLNEVLSIVGEFGSDRLYKIEERIGALEKKVK